MLISYFENQTAAGSEEIWKNFLVSCKKYGLTPVKNSFDADCAIIWSVVWKGVMKKNYNVYRYYRSIGKPVFIIEVGSLKRGITWKVSLNHVTKEGIYGNDSNFIPNRSKFLEVELLNFKNLKNSPILIALQNDRSLQWNNSTSIYDYTMGQINEIRKFTDRLIHVRPHPRGSCPNIKEKNVEIIMPKRIIKSYEEYDLFFDYSAIINYNSGVGLRSAWHGIPIVCDASSLASDVSMPLSSINEPYLPDRHDWFESIVHTEWTKEEIREGIPLERLLRHIDLTHTT